MLTYRVAYTFDENGWVNAKVLDFPGAISCGKDLKEARLMIADALVLMAESCILDGEPVPRPNPEADDLDADVVEAIYLVLEAGSRIGIVPEDAGK